MLQQMKLFLGIVFLTGVINAQANTDVGTAPEYAVSIKESGPFATKVDGKWEGLSVDLLNMLSKEVGFTYTFVDALTITDLIGAAVSSTTDLSIGAISLSDEREKYIDFSHPYFTTSAGVLVKETGSMVWFIAQRVIAVFVVLVIALYILGFIVSKLDPSDEIDNMHKGAWFVLVTYTTTGYGDLVPKNATAKVFAAFIMLASMFMLAAFTSYVTATLTIEKLSSNIVTLGDMSSKRANVVAVAGSSISDTLNALRIKHKTITYPLEGIELIKSDKASAFVYDKALLDSMILKEDNDSLIVHPLDHMREQYGIVFPDDSELREDFNIAILKIIASPEWKQLTAQYFGN